jgi:hypothetical protein
MTYIGIDPSASEPAEFRVALTDAPRAHMVVREGSSTVDILAPSPEWLRALAQQASLAAVELDTALEVKAAREANAANDTVNREPFGATPAPVQRIKVTADHYEISGSIGGEGYQSSECACGQVMSAPTPALLNEITVPHYWVAGATVTGDAA